MNDVERATAGEHGDYVHFLTGNEAYIREVLVDGAMVFGIHAPDGRLLGVAPDRELAFAAARQHQLEPLSVH
ncbi:MAG: DUF1150 family protein [Rhodospirillales bacterium]|nr:DUF1150 family protein [Rhodospirillales bacterium]MDE0381120.1 DUF1150 family protein [Rhodospirillales bacterium]